jgi:hypothetical protein
MTAEKFRAIALELDGAFESSHVNHPDFRVGGEIFATLGYPDERFGTVILTPAEQKQFLRSHPDSFTPANGAWGVRGATVVRLDSIDTKTLRKAILLAWKIRAPKTSRASRSNRNRGGKL